jgi:Predicted Zn-dependent protease (DUF2268)
MAVQRKLNENMRKTLVFTFLFSSLIVFAQTNKDGIRDYQTVILTRDVDHFWDAFDHLEKCKSFQDSITCLESLYFERGTAGFKMFISKYKFTPKDFAESISRYPGFFKSVRNNTLEVKKVGDRIDLLCIKLKESFPAYKPLKICFLISPLQSGGTAIGNFIIVGTEIIASTKKTDLSEFGTGTLGKVLAFDTNVQEHLIFVVAHETIHDMQVNADFNNYELLNKSLNEGSADFLAELFTGVQVNRYLYDYGNLHEDDLWKKFKKDIENNENTDNWMYNYDRVEEGVPADLGYYIGYKIVERYYKNSKDKKQALSEIILMKDPKEFLEKSRYGK